MSQNLDATAINQIHALISAQGVNEIISKIGADAVALPENFRIHDLEKFNLNRFRFRGALSTASIDDFTRYSKDLADEGTRCFIDADNMRAVSVLNLGTIDEGFLRGKCVPRDLKVNETNAEYLLRKFDALEAKCAALENKIIPVSAELPPANESVLLFDANGEGWLIGWRSLWYTWGQKETGEWQWTFQVGDLENVNITHWAVMPKAPEAGA